MFFSLKALLLQTMPLTAAPAASPLPPGAPIVCTDLLPTFPADEKTVRANPCWRWKHNAEQPGILKDVTCRVRGMGMNYKMPMPVCESISLDEVMLVDAGDRELSLPLSKAFVLQKYFIEQGHIPAASSGLWQLEAEIDQSLLIVFGYSIQGDAITPLTMAEVEKLGPKFMPGPGEIMPFEAAVDDKLKITLAPTRVVVAFSVTCCKEKDNFFNGILGSNRIYPHAMVIASSEMKSIDVSISVVRPATSQMAGPMEYDAKLGGIPALPDEMLTDIRPLLVADTNIYDPIPGPNLFTMTALPHWSTMFDWYETDPIGNKVGTGKPLTVVDASLTGVRPAPGQVSPAVKRLRPSTKVGAPPIYQAESIQKLPRQGEFDNLHLAPHMQVAPKAKLAKGLLTDDVTMAPFCIHDCLHTHWRWGLFGSGDDVLAKAKAKLLKGDGKETLGFDDGYQPYQVEGAPMVPSDQTVKLLLLPPAGFLYSVKVRGPVRVGHWNVFMHHGMAYANEIADPETVAKARDAVDLWSEQFTPEHQFPLGLKAANSWAIFYWRLRYGGTQNKPMERVIVPDPVACRKL
jgi:hypothetical protein